MNQPQFPRYAEPIAGRELTSGPWYSWFQRIDGLVSAGVLSEASADAAIAAICTALGSPDGTPANIPQAPILGIDPVSAVGTLATGMRVSLNLLGDSGEGALRGITRDAWGRVSGTTDATITPVAGETTVANGDAVAGPPTIGLADVPNGGDGAFQLFFRDAKGRVVATTPGDTDDVPEGTTNLYHTAARVRDTLLAGLSTASTAVITAADSVLSALGKLQAQITANVAALALKFDKAGGTVSGALLNAYAGVVLFVVQSTDNNPAQIRIKSSSTNRRFLAIDGTDVVKSQIVFGDNEISFAGQSDSTHRFFRATTAQLEPWNDNTRSLGTSLFRWTNVYGVNLRPGAGSVIWTSGSGSPEGVVVAPIGSLYTRTDGGAGTTLYVKESGVGNTGWTAK